MNSIIQCRKRKMLTRRYILFFTVILISILFSISNLFGSNSKLENSINREGRLINEINEDNVYDVSSKSSWKTIPEILAYLDKNMSAPSLIRLGNGSYDISSTQIINLPYDLTIDGIDFGTTKISASKGLNGKPMFRCLTNCYFKTIIFDGTTLNKYGMHNGEDAIRLIGSGTYNEIMDCTFDHFNNAIVDSTNAELWLFQCDVFNIKKNGVFIHGNIPGVKVRVSQTDFINCKNGVNMDKGSMAIIQINLGTYYNINATDSSIIYKPSTFSFSTMIITNNAWNSIGKLISGFDLTRLDLRDANAYIESNAGFENEKPHSKLNVLFNTSPTMVKSAGVWKKANFVGTNNYVVGFGLSGNKLTYLSKQKYSGVMNISGNIVCSNDSVLFSVAVVKNGNITKRYGERSVKVIKSNFQYQWFTNITFNEMTQNDYYEIWITSGTNNDVYILQDVQWFCNTQ